MLALQFAALKPGAFNIVNIADVVIKGEKYPLLHWTIEEATSLGFTHQRTDEFVMPVRVGSPDDDELATEPVIVMQKPA